MNKAASGNRLLIKAICIALAITFGTGLMATGVMANSGCGMKCCCQSKPMTRQHAAQEQIGTAMDCCSGNSQMPCDLVSATQVRIPEITLAAPAGHLPTVAGSTDSFSEDLIDPYPFRGQAFDQFARDKFRFPPLYLQNQSLII